MFTQPFMCNDYKKPHYITIVKEHSIIHEKINLEG